MHDSIIITIESGVVSEIYSSAPLQATIVDYDMIEGGETFERRLKKAVLPLTPGRVVKPEQIESLVRALVLECRRPRDDRQSTCTGGDAGTEASDQLIKENRNNHSPTMRFLTKS